MSAVERPDGADAEAPRAVLVQDAEWEAEELARRCRLIEDPAVQGLPLLTRDYVTLLVATVLIPALLIVIGNLT
ncbi:MAG: hypothetical protein JWR41_2929 [Modestobacter sp.]|jgi:hypothetical protein|nr:hypothetical protein [Modestobacter sp.]